MDSAARIVSCLQQVIAALDLTSRTDDECRNIIGLGLRESVLALYPDADDGLIDQFKDHYRHYYLDQSLQPTALFPGAFDTLASLAAEDYLMAVATGKSRRGLERSFDETASRRFFHMSRCADEACSKPHPQMLLEIMEILDVNPEQTLMIGDTEYDMLMASQAGTAALAVAYGAHEQQRLLKHQPIHCLQQINELPGWLRGQQEQQETP